MKLEDAALSAVPDTRNTCILDLDAIQAQGARIQDMRDDGADDPGMGNDEEVPAMRLFR